MAKNKLLTALLVAVLLVAGTSAAVADTWTTYNKNNTSGGIDNNSMRDVEIASNGDLWLATYGGGVSTYDGTNWTLFKTGDGLVNNTTWDIDIDSAGNIWIATSGGLSKYDGTNFTNYTTSNSDLSTNSLRDVYVDGSGIVWIGTYGDGLDKMDGTNWTNWVTSNSDIPNNRVWDIEPDGSYLWLGTEGGVVKFDKSSTFTTYNTSNSDLLNNTVRDVELESGGAVWICTNSGLNKLDGTTWSSWQTGDGLAKNTCYDVEIDSSGVVYIVHSANGADKFDGTNFTNWRTTNSDIIGNVAWAVHVEDDNNIYFGTTAGVSLLETGAEAPVADFSGSPTSGDYPLDVDFTDSSTGDVTSWSWTFGDGGTSTASNPSHQYDANGTFTVALTATGPGGSDNESKTDYITVTVGGGEPYLQRVNCMGSQHVDDSNNTWAADQAYTSENWGYVGGMSAATANPIANATEDELYQDQRKDDFEYKFDLDNGDYDITLYFAEIEQSSSGIREFDVTIEGVLKLDDYDIYMEAGGHDIAIKETFTDITVSDGTLNIVFDDVSDRAMCAAIFVRTAGTPVVDFSASPTSGEYPLSVSFTDLSTGNITGWSWSFGDGGTSVAENPSHQYSSTGDYTVSLTVTYPGGSDTMTKTDYISVNNPGPPSADFSGTPRSGPYPLTVDFNDLSTGNITSWSWTFGEGSTSAAQNPSFEYTFAATYQVVLTVTGPGGSNSMTKNEYISVGYPMAVPDFVADRTSGSAPLVVNFTDTSAGCADIWSYDVNNSGVYEFGGPWPDVQWTYNNPGTYSVKQRVRDCGTQAYYTTTKYDYITVTSSAPPAASFTASPTSGDYPLEVTFTNTSTGSMTDVSWDFGDTGTSTAFSPAHVYNAAGTYTVMLDVNGPEGSDSSVEFNYITVGTPGQPTAAFSGSPTSGEFPLTVNFTNQSTGTITSYNWDFGDSITSTGASPSHTYTYAGDFLVELEVQGPGGGDTETKPDYISVGTPGVPRADFTADTTSGYVPVTVNFTDTSTGVIDTWSWTFGDGGTSTQQDPSHQYADAGLYTVSLTASGPTGSDAKTMTNYIDVSSANIVETWYTYNKNNTSNGLGANNIRAVVFDGNDTYIGGLSVGLSIFDGNDWTNYKKTNSDIPNNDTWGLAFDSSGNLWLATNYGLSMFDGTNFTNYSTSNSDLHDNNLRCIKVDSSDNVWVGSIGGGVDKYDGTDFTQWNTGNSNLPHNNVYGIDIDSSGTVWAATFSGAAEFDGTDWTAYGSEVLPNDDCYDVFVDGNDNVWVATIRGLGKFDGTNWTEYEEENGMPKENSRHVCVDSDNIVYAGTYTGGVCILEGTTWTQYKTQDSNLAGNTVWSVEVVEGTNYKEQWFGTVYGLNLRELVEVAGPLPPTADFSGTPTTGDAALTVDFTDSSTGEITSWTWDFGDGQNSIIQSPSHEYQDAGTFDVSLTVGGPGGSDTMTKTAYITVDPAPPVPDFQADVTDGLPPLIVNFTDKSLGCVDTWQYDFDNNGVMEFGGQTGSAQWTYNTPGTYSVKQKVRDCHTLLYYTTTKYDYINVRVPLPPDANFTASTVSGAVPLRVTFKDISGGDVINSWSWTFGDGGTSTEQNPVHVYDEGDYTVSLTVDSDYGDPNTKTVVNYIHVGPPQAADANFAGTPSIGAAPLDVAFTDQTTGSITGWSWDFGDGGSSTEQHPSYTYNTPGTYTVQLDITGVLNNDSKTITDYIRVLLKPIGGSGLAIPDSPIDLDNTHPRLIVRGYGTDNGLWAKAQDTHAEVWERLIRQAPTGATFPGIDRSHRPQQAAAAFIISKIGGYGQYCQDMVRELNGHYFLTGGDDIGIANMETFYQYCLAYDAIVDDPDTQWLTASEKASALATMANYVQRMNFSPGDTWRVRPTHNFMVCRAAGHAAGTYNLRGESGYEDIFNIARQYCLTYHNERVNGLCDAPLSNNGPRSLDGFPYEGANYGAYQGSRALVHRHIMEMGEYPNPDTVLDENKGGFSQNFNLAYMTMTMPEGETYSDVCYRGDAGHGMLQAIRYHAALNKAIGVSDTSLIPAAYAAGLGEWYAQTLTPFGRGDNDDQGWWQGYEYIWFDASIDPLTPEQAGLDLWMHYNDTEYHAYTDSWDFSNPANTYIYFNNRGHDGHNYWNEGHGDTAGGYACQVQTSSHDGADNGHYGIFKNGDWVVENANPDGKTLDPPGHNILLVDGAHNYMEGNRGYQTPEMQNADCIGAVDSYYGHAIEGVMEGIYKNVTNFYRRYFFVIRDPLYILVCDDVESGHTNEMWCYTDTILTNQGGAVFTTPESRWELLYPQSNYTVESETSNGQAVISTTEDQLLWMVHTDPTGVSFSKSLSSGDVVATIGQDSIVYNPDGSTYTHGSISGDALLFSERTGGALIFRAGSATGSQYGVSCSTAEVNLSVKGRDASIYAYGTGTHSVTVTSPYGTDVFSIEGNSDAVSKQLTGQSATKPVADFIAIPTEGWEGYYTAEFVSLSTGWITDYLWEFGDGKVSTELAASHKYDAAGVYTVKLTVSGPGGKDSLTQTDYITVKDFANYDYPDYVITTATQAAFDAALDAIEASQTLYGSGNYPEWCNIGNSNWCESTAYGGGGKILFDDSIAGSTINVNWDSRIDSRNSTGNSDGKRDWFGDNLIIDGQDKNIRFVYTGSQACSQVENGSAFRIHGNDNIVRNLTWDRFPDGIHIRAGERNLLENITVNTVCEDAMTVSGGNNGCVDCIMRNPTTQNANDKAIMISGLGNGNNKQAPSRVVITGHNSSDDNQPQRCSRGDYHGMLVVRKCDMGGSTQGPDYSGENNMIIIEDNDLTTTKSGNSAGLRLEENVRAIVRHNRMTNADAWGIYISAGDQHVRAYGNIITGNDGGGVYVGSDLDQMIDFGGGLVDVWDQRVPTQNSVPIIPNQFTRAGCVTAASWGQNIITGNTAPDPPDDPGDGIDFVNMASVEVEAKNNFWDHTTVSGVQTTDVSANVDVDPLGVDPNN